jgi:general secretion pathway protein K
VTDKAASKRRRPGRRAGFALLAVVWGVGLIATMVVAFMTSGRLRLQAAHNIAGAVAAASVADGAINLTALSLIGKQNAAATTGDAPHDGALQFCLLDGAVVAVAIEDEGGKIDLNAAPPETLQALLLGLGVAETAAQDISLSIAAFRTAPLTLGSGAITPAASPQGDKAVPLKQAPFETVTELDQVGGVDQALYRLLLRFTTVSSRSPGVDAGAAPPALFAALAGFPVDEVRRLTAAPFPNALDRKDARFPAGLVQTTERSVFRLHAEALLATGQTASRDALLDLRPLSGKPFAFREWRRGDALYLQQLRAMNAAGAAGAPDC